MEQHQYHQQQHPQNPHVPADLCPTVSLNPPIKVKLKSKCSECESKLKKKLQALKGVNEVNFDHKRVVTVSGTIGEEALLEVIRKHYKRAQLVCPFDDSYKTHTSTKCSCSDHDDPDKVAVKKDSDTRKEKKKKRCCLMRLFCKNRGSVTVSPPLPRSTRPSMPVAHSGFPRHPWMAPHRPPPYFGGPPPPHGFHGGMPPPPNGFYGPPLLPGSGYPIRPPPRYNPMVHYTSYSDNYPVHRFPY